MDESGDGHVAPLSLAPEVDDAIAGEIDLNRRHRTGWVSLSACGRIGGM
jgi:hypothetical protein